MCLSLSINQCMQGCSPFLFFILKVDQSFNLIRSGVYPVIMGYTTLGLK